MPANPKHLTAKPSQQFAKITAGIIGGYIITALLHMCLVLWLPIPKEVLVTSTITIFLGWCLFSILPFLFKNGWKAWLIYAISISILYFLYSWANMNNPLV